MRCVAAVAVLVILSSACQPSVPALTEEQKAEIAAVVDSLTIEWWNSWRSMDVERGISFIHDAPEATWAGGPMRTVYGVAEMTEVWSAATAAFSRQELEVTNQETYVLASDVEWTLREMDYAVYDTTDAVYAQGQHIETAVWVKRNGEWKLLLGHDNDVTPPM